MKELRFQFNHIKDKDVKKTLSRELVKRARSRDKGLVMIPVCFSFRFNLFFL